jgi:hypothetical protein
MRFLSTKTNANKVDKHKIKGKLLQSKRTMTNAVVKYKNKSKCGC